MEVGKRLDLIKKISKILSAEEWNIIDLTLKQFGFPITDEWNSDDKHAYVIQMIQDETADKIIEIAKYLNITLEKEKVSDLDISCWAKNKFRLFISHISSNKKFAKELQKNLESYNISAFVAHIDIKPTKEWQSEIELALNSCDALIALLSPDFHESNWTDQEIGVAMGRGVLIISIRLGLDPYGFIGKFQGLQGKGLSAQKIAEQLADILLKNKQTEKKMVTALVDKFVGSQSWQGAKNNMTLLEKADWINDELIAKLKRAKKTNTQIIDAFGVPSRIDTFINKFNDEE